MASSDLSAFPLNQIGKSTGAGIVFTAFLLSVFFLNAGLANTVAVLCFFAAWAMIVADARAGAISVASPHPLLLAFFIFASIRLLMPPYGTPDAVPGAAVARTLLLVGFFGLTYYTYVRMPFSQVLWLLGSAAFACVTIALAVYVHHVPDDGRLQFLGRASHSIIGAGAIGAGTVAVAALLGYGRGAARSWPVTVYLSVALVVLAAAIYLTGSRGPMLALAFSLAITPIIVTTRSRVLLFASAFGAWALVTASVLFEAQIREALCPVIELACRSSLRQGVWTETMQVIAAHPLWGSGYGFRFEGIPHAHNSYFGIALHHGIPLCILFIGLMVVALWKAAEIENAQQRFFVVATLIFANGFMGSDLSDPMRFFSTHYVFLWFPLFLALLARQPAPIGTAAATSRA